VFAKSQLAQVEAQQQATHISTLSALTVFWITDQLFNLDLKD
jgi:hypothetical protein